MKCVIRDDVAQLTDPNLLRQVAAALRTNWESGGSPRVKGCAAFRKLFVEGHNYRTAAAELKVSPSTVNFHLQNIYQKLQVHSKTEAVAKALRNRLI